MTNPEPRAVPYSTLITDIETGRMKLPQFQRDFVWKPDASAKFMDSIMRGYPIGTFTIWRTTERLLSVKNIGDAKLPDTRDGESVQYVLDGQQRLASLFAIVKGLVINKKNYSEFYVNLEIDPNNPENNLVTTEKPSETSITIKELLKSDLPFITKTYPDVETQTKITAYRDSLTSYNFSVIEINDANLEKAVEIFERINTGGTSLSIFEIMVAKTYDEKNHFDLLNKYEDLNNATEQNGFSIPPITILQLLSIILANECRKATILSLNKTDIQNLWDDVEIAMKTTVNFFQNDFHIGGSQILPTQAFYVTLGYFFFKTKRQPTSKQFNLLQKYFWKSSLSARYITAIETKLAQDKNIIDEIIKEMPHNYGPEFNFKYSVDDIRKWKFTISNAITKSILCLFSSKIPLKFDNNQPVILSNDWLIRANSKNYHHFFPKAFLRKKGYEKKDINIVANITLIDDYLNKRQISDKAPSKYMNEFKRNNTDLIKTMTTHLIEDLDDYGVWKDNYEQFIKKRGSLIYQELEDLIK